MFAEGMGRFPGVTGAQVARMFPRIEELWALHAALLNRLRTRQRLAPSITTIADILAETFAPTKHHKLKAAYGECHNVAISMHVLNRGAMGAPRHPTLISCFSRAS